MAHSNPRPRHGAQEKAVREETDTKPPAWFRDWSMQGGVEWLESGPASSVEGLAELREAP